MKYECDMQVHSCYSSDGMHTPEELFAMAKKRRLKALVITDHNVVRGIEPSLKAAKKFHLPTLEAIEISTKYKEADIHILGYALRFKKYILQKGLKKTIDGYNQRSKKISEKVNALKIAKINFQKLLQKSVSFVTKPNIAQEISKQKKISLPEALRYVERGGPAFVPYGNWAMSPIQAVKIIHQAGGIAVLAHPGDIFHKRSGYAKAKGKKIFRELLNLLLKYSLNGIEVYYPTHTKNNILYFKKIAKKYNLIATGGSDWHSQEKDPDSKIGKRGISFKQFQEIVDYIKIIHPLFSIDKK